MHKKCIFGGVRRANTPNFCTFSHQSTRYEFPIFIIQFGLFRIYLWTSASNQVYEICYFQSGKKQHIGVPKLNPYFSRISRRKRLNRALFVEQSTDQALGLNRPGSFSKTRLPPELPIVLNVKPTMQLLNLTQQRNGGSTCTKIARFRGVRTANTPIFAIFMYQHGAYETKLVNSDSTQSLNSFGLCGELNS